jgi:hypothetical protein
MLEEHKAKKLAETRRKALAEWEARRAEAVELLELAQSFKGSTSDNIMLAAGEAIFYEVTEAALIEERRGAGHYEGRSQGVSIPVGSIGGRSVRYRVGASKGHYVQGAPTSTPIDTGTAFITNKRVIFQGTKQTRECAFAKLIGFQHDDVGGSTTFSVSNRQKPTTIHYGTDLAGSFDFRLDLALAHFRGTLDDLVSQLGQDVAKLDEGTTSGARTGRVAPRAATEHARSGARSCSHRASSATPATCGPAWLVRRPLGHLTAALVGRFHLDRARQ